jgi:hypothetical protein
MALDLPPPCAWRWCAKGGSRKFAIPRTGTGIVARDDAKERWNNFKRSRFSAGRGPLSISVFRFNPRYFSCHAFRK